MTKIVKKSMVPSTAVKVVRESGYNAVTRHYGGKRGASTILLGTKTPDAEGTVLRHEMAHARVKRSSYRLRQIASDPVKNAREEARADFISTGGKRGSSTELGARSKNPFVRSPEVRAYRQVQRKMRTSTKQGVSKGFTPWDGITSEVSKMSPDPSSVHVPGAGGRRTYRLRRLPSRTQGMS